MNKHQLSKRLLTIADIIDHGTLADIGTDHGYLGYYCLTNEVVTRAILSDVNEGPLKNAKSTFAMDKQKYNVRFRLGSGIETIGKGEVDTVVIAGMGGGLIKAILEKDMAKTKSFKHLILQPQTEQAELREWLLSQGFEILFDRYVFDDNKHYECFKVVYNPHFTPDLEGKDLEFGYKVYEADIALYRDFLRFKLNKYVTILEKLPSSDNPLLDEKRSLCQQKIGHIKSLL